MLFSFQNKTSNKTSDIWAFWWSPQAFRNRLAGIATNECPASTTGNCAQSVMDVLSSKEWLPSNFSFLDSVIYSDTQLLIFKYSIQRFSTILQQQNL